MTTLAQSRRRTRADAFRAFSACRLILALVVIAPCTAMWAQAQSGEPLSQQVDQLLQKHRFDERMEIGVTIIDGPTGAPLATHNDRGQFIPASNMKLLTSAAAIALLGPDFAFTTDLTFGDGILVIHGSGDPGLADPELLKEMGVDIESFLDTWVDAVLDSGAETVAEIILDTRIFDDKVVHESWPRDQLNRWYCAEVWGLNFHANVLNVYSSPAAIGLSPKVHIEPVADWINVENMARTVDRGQNTIWISRTGNSNDLGVHGSVRRATIAPIEVAMHTMPTLLGELLANRFEQKGMQHPSVRLAREDEVLPPGKLVAVVKTPMDVVLKRCNTSSHNLYAESLLKKLGHELTGQPGSWSSGAAVIRMMLQEWIGPGHAASVIMADGSGMSRKNRVPPRTMAHWLRSVAERVELREPFLQSLPIAGQTGTLKKRFRQKKPTNIIRAKTGYLNGVSSLSGYVLDDVSGRWIVFSVLVNGIPNTTPLSDVHRFQESVALIADQWLSDLAAIAIEDDEPELIGTR